MCESIDLSGPGWLARGFLGAEWQHFDAASVAAQDVDRWIPATVPGSVLADAAHAGLIPDPLHGTDSRMSEWVAQRTWVYQKRFRAPSTDGSARLVCEGIDFGAEVYLDGHLLGRSDSMFAPFTAEVGALPTGREHMLAIVLDPAPVSEPQVGYTDRVRYHKTRMNYGWDFCPRMIHQGLWRPVRIEYRGPIQIADVHVRAGADGTARVSLTGEASSAGQLDLTLRASSGAVVATQTVPLAASGTVSADLSVDNPDLWWTNGVGEPALYELTVAAYVDGVESDRRVLAVAFRDLDFVPVDGAPAGSLPYGASINGRRVFLKGWNWVPADVNYGTITAERIRHLLDLAQRAGVNLLRVWGGGLIETPEFYREAARRGILVWQEFIQSSSGSRSVPAEDASFCAMMEREARAIVVARRNEPALAIWCGGNELQAPDNATPLGAGTPVIDLLARIVAELDPDRLFLPTSPSGPRFLNNLDLIELDPSGQHDVHGPWEHQGLSAHYRLYNSGTCQLLSEFGAESMAYERTIARVVPAQARHLPTRGDPIWDHLGRWWNNESLVQQSFGDIIDSIPMMSRASQFLGADGLAYATEAHRARDPHCAGTIPWQFNEPFPNGWCTAAVDYFGEPKPAYHAIRRAYGPLAVSAEFPAQRLTGAVSGSVRVMSDQAGDAQLRLRILDLDGACLRDTQTALELEPGVNPAGPVELDTSYPAEVILVHLEISQGDRRAERSYWLTRTTLAPLLRLSPRAVTAVAAPGGRLTLRSEQLVPFVRLRDARCAGEPGWIDVSDSGFDLLPGVARTVTVRTTGEYRGRAELIVDGFGYEPQIVTVLR